MKHLKNFGMKKVTSKLQDILSVENLTSDSATLAWDDSKSSTVKDIDKEKDTTLELTKHTFILLIYFS